MPIVGKGVPSQLVLFHQGSLPGALALVVLLPDTDTVILVLSNSLALNDVADWVGQLVLEEVLEVLAQERVDFTEPARDAVAENLKWYPALVKELAEHKKKGTSPRDFQDYVGTYCINSHVFKILTVWSQPSKMHHGTLPGEYTMAASCLGGDRAFHTSKYPLSGL
ncbi:hypothetical protein C8A00DRAFT_31326, partial [Chaetomidium leptoderma]